MRWQKVRKEGEEEEVDGRSKKSMSATCYLEDYARLIDWLSLCESNCTDLICD